MAGDNGAALPPAFRKAGEHPAAEVLQAGDVRVGVLLFPALPRDAAKAPDGTAQEVADLALELRERSDLVVGISPWGARAEADFLDTRGHTVDVLLGAGPGVGFPARPMADDQVLWSRPYARARPCSR